MSASIDERIVSMQFDNKQFESGVKESLNTIDKLKKSMDFDKSVKSLNQLEKATNQLSNDSLSNMEKSLYALEKRFSAFGIVGMKAIENVTDSAMNMAKKMASKVVSPINKTLTQIKTGGLSRALKIEDATFKIKGLLGMTTKSMDAVNSKVKKLMASDGPILSAVKGTAYGLDAAAGAASNLLASGVKIKNLEGPLTAISGAAAMTGRSYEDIANIFSTVAGQGKIMTMQLRQFEAANVNAAAVIARHIGKTEAEVRDMVQQGKVDFQTFSDAMGEAFAGAAKKANDTMQGALSNVNAALSRIGAAISTPLDEMKRKTYVALIPLIDNIKKVLDPTLSGVGKKMANIEVLFKKIGKEIRNLLSNKEFLQIVSGFLGAINIAVAKATKLVTPLKNVLVGLWNIFKALASILKPIAQAFLDIFPLPSIKRIQEGAKSFREFTEKLKLSAEASETIRKIFRGLFQVLSVGLTVLKAAWRGVKQLATALSPLAKAFGSLAEMVATFMGSLAYYLQVIIVTISYVNTYIGGIGNVFRAIIGIIALAISSVAQLFTSIFEPMGGFFKGIAESLGIAIDQTNVFTNVLAFLGNMVSKIIGFAIDLFTDFGGTISRVASAIMNWLRTAFNGAFSWLANLLSTIGTGIANFFKGFVETIKKTGSIVEAIKETFSGFVDMLKKAGEGIASIAKPVYATVVEALGKAFGFLADGFKKFASMLTPGRIAAIAFLAILVAMSIAVKKFIDVLTYAIATGTKAIATIPTALTGVLNEVKKTFSIVNDRLLGKGNGAVKFINVLKELAKVFLILFGALYMISTLDQDKVWSSVKAMGAIAAGFIALALAFTFLGKRMAKEKFASSYGFRQLAIGMTALSAALAVLAISFRLLDGVNTKGLIVKTAAIGMIMAILGIIAMEMGKNVKEFTRGTVGVLFFALGVGRIVSALADLTEMPLHKIITALPILLALMASFGVLAKSVSGIKLPSTLGLIVMVLGLKMFIKETEKLVAATKDVSAAGFLAAVGSMIAAIVAVAILLHKSKTFIISKLRDFGIAMILVAGAVFAIAMVIKMFDEIKIGTIGKGLLAVGGIMALIMGLAAVSQYTEKAKPVKFAASLLLIAGAVGMLAGLVVLFGLISIPTLAKGMSIITMFMALFAGLMVLSQFTEKAQPLKMGGMFMLMAGAIAMLAGIVVVLGLIDMKDVVQGTLLVSAIIGLLSLLTYASKYTAKSDPTALGKMFLKMSIAIGIMTACIVVLGKMDVGTVIQGGAIIAAFIAAMALLENGMKGTRMKGMKIAGKTLAAFLSVLGIMMIIILAMKMLEGMDFDTMIGATAGLSVAILAISGAMWIISKNPIPSAKDMLAFVTATLALLPIAMSLIIVAKQPWDGMLAGAAALSTVVVAFGAAFMLIGKAGDQIKIEHMAGFLLASASMLVIAASLLIVANQPWEGLIAGAVSIAACLLVYGQVFSFVSTCPKPDAGVIAGFIAGSTALVVIGFGLAMAASQPWDRLLAAGAAMSLVIGTYGLVFAKIAKIDDINLAAMAIFLAGTLALSAVGDAIGDLAGLGYDWKTMLSAAVSIAAVIVAYGAIYRLVASMPFAAAGNAFANLVTMFASMAVCFDEVVVIVGGLMAAIGAINDFLGGKLAKWVHDTIPIIKDIGEAIGGFVGEIVGSFGEAIINHLSDTLPHLGKCLSEFGENAQPFFDILSKLSPKVTDSALVLAETMMILGGASFLDGISNFFNKVTLGLFKGRSISEMGDDLVEFGKTLKKFQDASQGVNPDAIGPVAEAAKNLASVADEIGNTGGLFQLFTGETDWYAFNNGIRGLITTMVTASNEAANINGSNIEMVAACGEALGKMSDAMPRDNGLLQTLTGSIDWYKFKNGIINLVSGMVQVCNMEGIDNLTDEKIKLISNCGTMLTDMAQKIPNSGGLISWFAGENDLDDFAPQIEKFGMAMASFATSTNGINPGNVERASTVSKIFLDMCALLDEFGGNNLDLQLVSEVVDAALPMYGETITKFSDSMAGADMVNLEKGKTATEVLLSTFQMARDTELGNFKDFATTISSFGLALRGLNTDLVGLDSEEIDLYVSKITELATKFAKSVKGTDFGNISGFAKSMEELNKVMNNIKAEQIQNVKDFKDKIIDFGDAYRLMGEKIKGVKAKSIETAIKSVNNLLKAFGGKKADMDFGNFEKLAKNMGKIADLAKIANKADGKGNLNDMINTLKELGKNAKELVTTFAGINTADMVLFSDNIKALKNRFDELGDIKTKNGKKVGEALKSISDGATDAVKNGLDEIDKKIPEFKTKAIDCLKDFNTGLGNSTQLKLIKTSSTNICDAALENIKRTKFMTAGNQMVSGFRLGLQDEEELRGVSKAAAEMGTKALKALNKSLDVNSPSKETEKTAEYTVMGYTKGLEKYQKQVYESGIKMGDAAKDGIKDSLEIHSPSKFSLEAAYNTAKGWIMGCAQKAKELFSSGFSFGGSFIDGLKNAISSINKDSFSGDKMFDSIKKNLGIDKLGKLMEEATDTKNLGKDIGKSFKAGAAAGVSDAKKGGAKLGKAAKDGFTEQMKFNSILLAADIKGSDITKLTGDAARKMAKNIGVSMTAYTDAINKLKSDLKDFDKASQNIILHSEKTIKKYIKSYKDASASSAGVVKNINKNFKDFTGTVDKQVKSQIKSYEKAIKKLEKARKKYNKVINNDKSTKAQKKQAKQSLKEIDKEIKNYEKKMKATTGGNILVNNFAEALYKSSDAYKTSKKNIESYTKEYQKQAKLAQKYLNIIDDPKKSDKQKKKAYENLQKVQEKVTEVRKNLTKEWNNIANGPNKALKEWRKTTKEAIKELTKFTNLDYSYKIISGLEKVDKVKGVLDDVAQGYDILSESASNASEAVSLFGDTASNSFDMFSVSLDKTSDSANDANDAISNTINILERFTKTGTVAKEALFENADSQLEAYREYLDGLSKMKSMGFNNSLIDEMAKSGPTALNYIRGFLSMNEDEINSYNKRYEEKLSYESTKIEKQAKESGENTTRSYLEALEDGLDKEDAWKKKLEQLAEKEVDPAIIKKFKEGGREQSEAYVDSLLKETDEGIKKVNDIYKKTNSLSYMDTIKEKVELNKTYNEVMNQLDNAEFEGTKLDTNIVDEIKEMSKDQAILYGQSILDNLENIPTLNSYYAELNQNDTAGSKSLLDVIKKNNETVLKNATDIANFDEQLVSRGANANLLEYFRSLDTDKALDFIKKFNHDISNLTDENAIGEYMESLNEEFKSFNRTGAQVIVDNIQSQLDSVKDYNDDMAALEKKFAGGQSSIYYKYLEDMGIEGASFVKSLATATAEEIKAFQDMVDAQTEANNKARVEKLKKDQQKKYETLANYGKNMEALAIAGLDSTFLQSIIDMGPEAGAEMAEMYANLLQTDPQEMARVYKMVTKDATDVINDTTEHLEAALAIAKQKEKSAKETEGDGWLVNTIYAILGVQQAQDYLKTGKLPENLANVPIQAINGVSNGLKEAASSTTVAASNKEAGSTMGKQLNSGISESISEEKIATTVSNSMNSKKVKNSMKNAGSKIVEGVADGLKSDTIKKSAKSAGKTVVENIKTNVNHDKGKSMAKNLVLGIRDGIKAYRKQAVDEARELGENIYNALANFLNYDTGYDLGYQISNGVLQGLLSLEAEVEAAAARIAAAAAAAMAAAAQVNSPSKVTMKIGEALDEGLVVGMNKGMDSVEAKATTVAERTTEVMDEAMRRIDSILESDDYRPVIRPVLDLTDVTNKASSINRMFDANMTAKYSGDTDSDSQNQNGANSVTFVQNNYSPKALDRLEIYRQTNNQFAMARRAVTGNA